MYDALQEYQLSDWQVDHSSFVPGFVETRSILIVLVHYTNFDAPPQTEEEAREHYWGTTVNNGVQGSLVSMLEASSYGRMTFSEQQSRVRRSTTCCIPVDVHTDALPSRHTLRSSRST